MKERRIKANSKVFYQKTALKKKKKKPKVN